jgi:hypothetical protein
MMAVFVLFLMALMLTAYLYYRSAYLRGAGDWWWFWVGEKAIGVWLVYAVATVFSKTPKL